MMRQFIVDAAEYHRTQGIQIQTRLDTEILYSELYEANLHLALAWHLAMYNFLIDTFRITDAELGA